MIGITTYRDYFAASDRSNSSKFESLCQYAIDVAEALGEEAEIVSTNKLANKGSDFSRYSKIVLFEHPTSFVGRNGWCGFTSPNVVTQHSQLMEVLDYKGEVIGCYMELQKQDVWIARLGARRKHHTTGQWKWPTDEELYDMFDRGITNSMTSAFKKVRLTRPVYAVGDSHTLMMWKPGSTAEAIPAKTLYSTLRDGLLSVVPSTAVDLTLCFGNIDLRHHFNRQENPVESAEELAKEYVRQASELNLKDTKICKLLPIISLDRRVSNAYFYKGEPHSGTLEERMNLREKFNAALDHYAKSSKNVIILDHPDSFYDQDGLFAKKAVERTNGGIHLASNFYEWRAFSKIHQPEYAWR